MHDVAAPLRIESTSSENSSRNKENYFDCVYLSSTCEAVTGCTLSASVSAFRTIGRNEWQRRRRGHLFIVSSPAEAPEGRESMSVKEYRRALRRRCNAPEWSAALDDMHGARRCSANPPRPTRPNPIQSNP